MQSEEPVVASYGPTKTAILTTLLPRIVSLLRMRSMVQNGRLGGAAAGHHGLL